MVEGPLAGDVPPGPADDHRKLALEIETLRDARPHQRAQMPHLRARPADEHHRMAGKGRPLLGGVVAIIEADADHLVGPWDHREERHVLEGEIGGRTREGAQRVEAARALEGRPEIGDPGQPSRNVDEPALCHDAEGGPSPALVARDFHESSPPRGCAGVGWRGQSLSRGTSPRSARRSPT